MKHHINFRYYISEKKYPLSEKDGFWNHPLPLSRKPELLEQNQSFTYGDYFKAVRSFLQKTEILNSHKNIKHTDIFVKKHGEFYHPAKIEVVCADKTIKFAANAAVSAIGKKQIKQEYGILKQLYDKSEISFIPKVYDFSDTNDIPIFLAEWIEGLSEFHISFSNNQKKIVVWDETKGNYFLSPNQIQSLYRNTAMILTWYYDICELRQISMWHHAAGDFIIMPVDNDKVRVKLISARKYSPIIQEEEPDIEIIINCLLIFFLNLSIKNRLDRLDGTGDIVWADDSTVKATVKGFFDGLKLKVDAKEIPYDFIKSFKKYISGYTQNSLYEAAFSIVERVYSETEEFQTAQLNLENHIKNLSNTLTSFLS